jgi:hypothetical protein
MKDGLMVSDDLRIRADHDSAMARTLIGLEQSLANENAAATSSGEMIDRRCPKCNCSLLTDGEFLWCSFIGGRDVKACDYGINDRVSVDPPQYRQSEFIDSDKVCVKVGGETFVCKSVFIRLMEAEPLERIQLANSLEVIDLTRFSLFQQGTSK